MAYIKGQGITHMKPGSGRWLIEYDFSFREDAWKAMGWFRRMLCQRWNLSPDEWVLDLYNEADRRGDELSQANECLDMVRQALKEHSPAWPKDTHDIGAMFYNDQIRSMSTVNSDFAEYSRQVQEERDSLKSDVEALQTAVNEIAKVITRLDTGTLVRLSGATPEPQENDGHFSAKQEVMPWCDECRSFHHRDNPTCKLKQPPTIGEKLMSKMQEQVEQKIDHEWLMQTTGVQLTTNSDRLTEYNAKDWAYFRELDDDEHAQQWLNLELAFTASETTEGALVMTLWREDAEEDDELEEVCQLLVKTRDDVLASMRMLGIKPVAPKGLQNAADAKAPD